MSEENKNVKNIISENIKVIREEKGRTQEEFASILSLQRNTISLIENGKRNPSDRTIRDICEKFNVSEKWLRTGIGDKYQKFGPIDEEDEFSLALGELTVTENESVKELFRKIYRMNPKDRATLTKAVEVLIKSDII